MKFFTFYKQVNDGDNEYYYIIKRFSSDRGQAFFHTDEFGQRRSGWKYMGINLEEKYWDDTEIIDSSQVPNKHQLIKFNFEGYV